MSAFVLEDGVVYHTYSTYARGLDGLWGMYQWLDRAPKGRNETGVWWRRHDEYEPLPQNAGSCCHAADGACERSTVRAPRPAANVARGRVRRRSPALRGQAPGARDRASGRARCRTPQTGLTRPPAFDKLVERRCVDGIVLRSSARRCRELLFRVLAIGIGLAPLAACEAILRALDLGRPCAGDDPFVGFSSTRPLFELSQDGTRYEISRAHEKFFRRDGFAAVKPPDEFRIFCLGGSTVQGRPFSIETSFTTWLELSLRAAEPGRRWRVVNCGGVSYATYREASIVEEVLRHQPDLFILCTGHNEFLEDRSYAHLKRAPAIVPRAVEQAPRLRTFGLVASA